MSPDLEKVTFAGLLAILVGCLVGVVVPAGLGWDFANFYDAGHKALAGQVGDLYDPRSLIDGRPAQGTMTFWSVPLASYLLAPLALFPPRVALVLFKLQNVVVILAALYALHRLALPFATSAGVDPARFTAVYVWLALLFQPLWTVFRVGGQTTPTVLLLLTLGLLFHLRGQWWGSSLCYVLAVILKPAFAPGLLFLGLTSGRRFLGATAAWGLGLAALAVLVMGWEVHRVFLDRMLGAGDRSTAWMHNSALTVPLESLRMLWVPGETAWSRPRGIELAVQVVRGATVLLFVWLAVRARRLDDPARRHAVFLLSVLFALLAGPVVWEHYLSLLFIPLSYLLAVRGRLGPAASRAVGAVFLFALFQNLILVLWVRDTFTIDSAAGLLLVGLVKAAPLILTLVVIAHPTRGLLGTYRHPEWRTGAPTLQEVAG